MDTIARVSPCPNCGSRNLFRTVNPVSAGGGYSPDFLPGLGNWLGTMRLFHIVLCGDCGLMRYFARQQARDKVVESKKWERVVA